MCTSDRVGILTTPLAETTQLYESVSVETDKLRAEIAAMETDIREYERLEKDIPNLQRRRESLRRELESLDHQRIRAKQEFEMQAARKLKPNEEALELAYPKLENCRRAETGPQSRGAPSGQRQGRPGDSPVENEYLKFDEAISLYGLYPTLLPEDFWVPHAQESLLESAVFKQGETQIEAAFEKQDPHEAR